MTPELQEAIVKDEAIERAVKRAIAAIYKAERRWLGLSGHERLAIGLDNPELAAFFEKAGEPRHILRRVMFENFGIFLR